MNRGNPPPLLYPSEIARRLKRSPRGVISAIERLNIQAEEQRGRRKLYSQKVVKILQKDMRSPNRNGTLVEA